MKVIQQILQGEANPDVLVEAIHGRIIQKHSKNKIQSKPPP